MSPTRRRKTRVGKEENFYVARREHGIGPPVMEARVKGDVDALDEMLPPTSLATPNCFPKKSPAAKA
jgi:hypothetical protein